MRLEEWTLDHLGRWMEREIPSDEREHLWSAIRNYLDSLEEEEGVRVLDRGWWHVLDQALLAGQGGAL